MGTGEARAMGVVVGTGDTATDSGVGTVRVVGVCARSDACTSASDTAVTSGIMDAVCASVGSMGSRVGTSVGTSDACTSDGVAGLLGLTLGNLLGVLGGLAD